MGRSSDTAMHIDIDHPDVSSLYDGVLMNSISEYRSLISDLVALREERFVERAVNLKALLADLEAEARRRGLTSEVPS